MPCNARPFPISHLTPACHCLQLYSHLYRTDGALVGAFQRIDIPILPELDQYNYVLFTGGCTRISPAGSRSDDRTKSGFCCTALHFSRLNGQPVVKELGASYSPAPN